MQGWRPARLEEVERQLIEDALARVGGVQTRAAELLGIGERALRYKLKKLGLRDRGAAEEGEP